MKIVKKMCGAAFALALVATGMTMLGAPKANAGSTIGHILTVGTYKGIVGQYTTIQAAVNAAQQNDWILVAPGVYRETNDMTNPPADADLRKGNYGAVLVTKKNLHIRGLDRFGVVVDGTASGASCNSLEANQNFGPQDSRSRNIGRNGIVVYKADNVDISNLTTCNFLGGAGDSGNNIWWNGGAGSGVNGLTGYSGSYLTATDTYNGGNATAATYGIFSSDASGSATTVWDHVYASNFNDAGMYVGACQQKCYITINHAWMENNALGYSGTNSGGAIVVMNSRFDKNQDGFDTNTQIAGDPPPPQNGACPKGAKPSVKGATNCFVLVNNIFDHNNNSTVPKAGGAAAGPLGTGLTISGGRNDTIMNNTFSDNGAWGLMIVPFPDGDTPPAGVTCANSGGHPFPGLGCIYDPQNITVTGNKFTNNGFYGNPSNGDIGEIVLGSGQVLSCYSKNTNTAGGAAHTYPTDLQTIKPTCKGGKSTMSGIFGATSLGSPILAQALCDTGFGGCDGVGTYPKSTTVILAPLPAKNAATGIPGEKHSTMPNPCLVNGVKGTALPANRWCNKGKLK